MEKHYSLLLDDINYEFWFIFFTLIGFAELYKIYISSKIEIRCCKIKKIISTNKDLFSEENNNLFQNENPRVVKGNICFKYEIENIGKTNNDIKHEISEVDREQSEKYRNHPYIFVFEGKENNIDFNNIEDIGINNDYKALTDNNK